MNPQPDPNSSLLKWAVIFFVISIWALSGIKAKAAEANGVHIPKEKEINFSYTYLCPDTGSMRPAIWDGDTLRVWAPTVRPWAYGMNLLGKIVIRKGVGFTRNGRVCHRIIAITPRGAITRGDNNVCDDPGFMSRDGSDYDGEVTVEVHQAHPGKQRLHSFQKM